MTIRNAEEKDIPQLWEMMRDLAIFEKYIKTFKITEEIVLESGFQKSPPDFHAIVATEKDELLGMIVYYLIPYTATARPSLFIKELFVKEAHRSKKVGEKLMKRLAQEAKKQQCATIKWNVASWNKAGLRFYERLGAYENKDWLNYELDEATLLKLAD